MMVRGSDEVRDTWSIPSNAKRWTHPTNGCTHLFLLWGSDYLTTNFLPFLIYTPFEASPVMRRPARSKIGAFVTSAPSTSGIPIAEGVSWKLNVRALAVVEQYLLATLAAWREKYHAINICEKKLSQRRKERKDNVRSKRFWYMRHGHDVLAETHIHGGNTEITWSHTTMILTYLTTNLNSGSALTKSGDATLVVAWQRCNVNEMFILVFVASRDGDIRKNWRGYHQMR